MNCTFHCAVFLSPIGFLSLNRMLCFTVGMLMTFWFIHGNVRQSLFLLVTDACSWKHDNWCFFYLTHRGVSCCCGGSLWRAGPTSFHVRPCIHTCACLSVCTEMSNDLLWIVTVHVRFWFVGFDEWVFDRHSRERCSFPFLRKISSVCLCPLKISLILWSMWMLSLFSATLSSACAKICSWADAVASGRSSPGKSYSSCRLCGEEALRAEIRTHQIADIIIWRQQCSNKVCLIGLPG